MLKFERLNIVTASKLRKRLILGLAVMLMFSISIVALCIISSQSENLNRDHRKLLELQSESNSLLATIQDYTNQTEALSVEKSPLTTKEQFIVCIGECAKQSGCAITALSCNEPTEGEAITKFNFTFEIKGDLSQISQVMSSLDAKGLCYSVNTISLRQEADYIWLQRDITDNITWWDLSNYASGGEASRSALSTEAILADTSMRLYINLDFIVINNLM